MKTENLKLLGMSCSACAVRIEKNLLKLNGIKKAEVNYASEKANLEFDDKILSINDIVNNIKKSGYDVGDPDSQKEVLIPISGMTCTACSNRIEKALTKLDGIIKAEVSFASEKAKVFYDPKKIRIPEIKQCIKKSGYMPLEVENNKNIYQDKNRKQKEIKIMFAKFFVSAFFSIPLLYIAMAPMIKFIILPYPEFLVPMKYPITYALVELILLLPIIAAGYKFYVNGFKSLIARSPNMDSLISMGTISAIIYSLYSLYKIINNEMIFVHNLYFETAGIIITLILLGKSLETLTKGKTSDAIKKLIGLSPKTAIILKNNLEIEISVEEIEPGDIILVKPGEKIPVDGEIIEGQTTIDESMLTGESMPIEKKTGDKIIGSSINKNGFIKMKATKVGDETVLAGIIKLVENAQNSKAEIAKLADIVSGYFVPIVFIIAALSGLSWFFLGGKSIDFSLLIFISILVVACPCALGLATPTAIMVGTGIGAKYGILIKSSDALEKSEKLTTIVLDKTGTITEGKPEVSDVITANGFNEEELLGITGSIEKKSEHPLADAIVKYATMRKINFIDTDNFTAIPGFGIEASMNGKKILVGNEKLIIKHDVDISEVKIKIDQFEIEAKTPIFTAVENKLVGVIAVTDKIKSDSFKAIQKMKKRGLEVIMITGDNRHTAGAVAKLSGIDNYFSEILPQGKHDEIKKMQSQGKTIAMVGDGINDAAALAQSDVGIAVSSGSDVAIESADIILMKNSLLSVMSAIKLSKKTILNIKQNLFWAFGYNVLLIPLAAGVFYLFGGPLLNPMFAALAMSISSVSVVTNALRLKFFKPD